MGVAGGTRHQLDLPGVAGRQGKAQILTTKGGLQAYLAGEPLFLYLAVTEDAASAVLVREEDRVQRLVYYIRKRLLGVESRYPLMEKLAFCLITASRKLRPYF